LYQGAKSWEPNNLQLVSPASLIDFVGHSLNQSVRGLVQHNVAAKDSAVAG
jgi:hypothetical protein